MDDHGSQPGVCEISEVRKACLDGHSLVNVEWLSRIVKSAETLNRLERFDRPVLIPNTIL
jgi:hypothetical protein